MLTLAIETSSPRGSLALVEGDQVLKERSLEFEQRHGQALVPDIRSLLPAAGRSLHDLSLIAVSVGPGSFTGLRVGVVCAKALAYALECPVVGVDTLRAIACNCPVDVATVQVISDAQRGDVFVGRYARGLT